MRRYEMTRRNYVLSYTTPGASGLWDPEIVLGYGVTELAVPEPFGSDGETSSLSLKFANNLHLSPRSVIAVGTDVYRDRASYAEPDTSEVREQITNVGAFAQARLQPLDPLRLSAGLRADRQEFEGLDGTEFDDSGLSGNVSIAYDITDALTLTAAASNVWGGITLAENFILNPAWEYDPIDPVRARSQTVGFVYETGPFSLDGRVFRTDFDNAREASWRGGPSETIDFRSEGYSLGAGYRWAQGFARLSYTDSEISVDGDSTSSYTIRAHGAPLGRIFNLELAYWLAPIDVMLGGTLEAALKIKIPWTPARPLEAYEVVNVYAEYRPRGVDGLSLRLEVSNLFDETYAQRATYGQDFEDIRPLAEPGRSFALNARMEF
ncbi:TonB-dependent receptor domain-containing protein [Alkalilimnicola ehrlichii]|uniref:TonB-dependent receptor domain-containing protein n=1 Tax=Alkalilimnicola ehrlichii TaxID=351052 RepID=UPI0011C074AF|nr:TonB-dependent receptor [Alkalilimnicola ehrlichii]